MSIARRQFLQQAAAGMGALGLGSFAAAAESKTAAGVASDAPPRGLPVGWRQLKKYDAHNHLFAALNRPDANWGVVETLIEAADSVGIEKLFCSRPITGGVMADIAAVRDVNDSVLAAMKRYPARIAGYCFVQPGIGPAALEEIDRCLEAGMMGVKLYNQYKYSDPVVFPVAEKCIARRIPFLGHSGFVTDPKAAAAQPHISHALDFCALSRRYPELLLIMGHVNGGGDWEWQIKALRECPNVFVDSSGSVLEDDTIGRCVRELGHRRLLFATDQTIEGGVGKILSAELTSEQREDIFWRNFQRILDRRNA